MEDIPDEFIVILENTVYWDGDYSLKKSEWGWEYQGDYCFYIKAHISEMIVIELYQCDGLAACFHISNENERTSASEISDEYRCDLKNATAKIEFW